MVISEITIWLPNLTLTCLSKLWQQLETFHKFPYKYIIYIPEDCRVSAQFDVFEETSQVT